MFFGLTLFRRGFVTASDDMINAIDRCHPTINVNTNKCKCKRKSSNTSTEEDRTKQKDTDRYNLTGTETISLLDSLLCSQCS